MIRTVIKIEDMMCGMCEAHICEVIRKTIPNAKKVNASRSKKEASFLSDEAVDMDKLKETIAQTGYTCKGINCEPYEKKGWFR